METAIDNYPAAYDEEHALDLMQLAFRRAVKSRRGPPQ
jgi:hypothetical protein